MQRKRAEEMKGAMRKYIVKKMREMASEKMNAESSIMSIMQQTTLDDTTSEMPAADVERRNLAIFKNLTFD